MNRSAKFFRSFGGFLMILEFAVGFCPMLILKQENYPDRIFSIYKLILNGFGDPKHAVLIMALTVLPLLLALIMGIIGIVGNIQQVISCIGGLIVFAGNGAFVLMLPKLQSDLTDTQTVQRGIGAWILLGVGAAVAVFSVLGLISTPRGSRTQDGGPVSLLDTPVQGAGGEKQPGGIPLTDGPGQAGGIPFVNTPDRGGPVGNADAMSGVGSGMEQPVEAYNSQSPRGVMVGLEGIYRGAEIPFQANETLKLGRDQSNDLIFEQMKKVSRFHCALTWMPDIKKYRVIDRSTNGCFINGNEDCIPQNIAIDLEPGTIFAVGDQTNVFRLE